MNFCGGCPGYLAKRGQSHAPDPGANSRSATLPTPQPAAFPLSSIPSVHHLLHPLPLSLAAGVPRPLLPPSPLPPLLPATHLASLPPCCGSPSRSLGLFACLSLPWPGWLPVSCVVVSQIAQAHCSPPPSSLSTSGTLLMHVVARVRPTGSSAHRLWGALALHVHRPCIARASHLHHPCILYPSSAHPRPCLLPFSDFLPLFAVFASLSSFPLFAFSTMSKGREVSQSAPKCCQMVRSN